MGGAAGCRAEQTVPEIQVKREVQEWLLMPLPDPRPRRGYQTVWRLIAWLTIEGVIQGYSALDL